MKDSEFLSWIWQRMVNKHGENSNVDYMLRLNGIIISMRDAEAESVIANEKPARTKVEYVKVTESIFDLKEEFESGELWSLCCDGEYELIDSEKQLAADKALDCIYRKVTKTERELFVEEALLLMKSVNSESISSQEAIELMFDSGKFALVDKE